MKRRRKYRMLSAEEFRVVDTYVKQCLVENPSISLIAMFKSLKKNWTGEQKLTYGHVLAAWRRHTGYKPKTKRAPKTHKEQTGQHAWTWAPGDTSATMGSLHVSYMASETVFDQGIRLIKAGLLLIEGGKSGA